MNDVILEKIDAEIVRLMERLKILTPGSEEYAIVQHDLVNLIDRREKALANVNARKDLELKEKKLDYDEIKNTDDSIARTRELDERKKDRFIGYLIEGGKALGTLAFCTFMAVKGFQFEETGSYTSNTFKEGRNNMFKMVFKK